MCPSQGEGTGVDMMQYQLLSHQTHSISENLRVRVCARVNLKIYILKNLLLYYIIYNYEFSGLNKVGTSVLLTRTHTHTRRMILWNPDFDSWPSEISLILGFDSWSMRLRTSSKTPGIGRFLLGFGDEIGQNGPVDIVEVRVEPLFQSIAHWNQRKCQIL